MTYWRVLFETPRVETGWLVFQDGLAIGVFNDDGTPAPDILSYVTTDTEPLPPEWADVA